MGNGSHARDTVGNGNKNTQELGMGMKTHRFGNKKSRMGMGMAEPGMGNLPLTVLIVVKILIMRF